MSGLPGLRWARGGAAGVALLAACDVPAGCGDADADPGRAPASTTSEVGTLSTAADGVQAVPLHTGPTTVRD